MKLRVSLAASVALAALVSLAGSAHAVTLPMYFDDLYDGVIGTNSIVGTGTFTFNTDPGNGDFTAAQLGGVTYIYTINGVTFDQTGDVTFWFGYDTTYRLSGSGANRRVQFLPDNYVTSKYVRDPIISYATIFDYLAAPGSYVAVSLSSLNFAGDYYIGGVIADVPEPSAVAFGVIAAGSVLGLVARKRRK